MSESEKQVVHASDEASATNPAEVTANSASTRAGVADATAAATASAAVTSSEKTVKTKKKGQKYKYRGAVLMSKSVSALFCRVTEKTLPKSGFKKIHVDGALSRLKWSIEKFMTIYLDFRETFAGRDTDLVRFYLKHRLNGGVWDKVGCLKKMAELGRLHRQQQNRHLKGRIQAITNAEFSDSSASASEAPASAAAVDDDDDLEPPKKRSKKRTKKGRRKNVRTKKKAKRRDRKWRLAEEESVTDSDPAVYSRKDSDIVLRSMQDIVAGVHRGHMTDFRYKWFWTMMKKKSLGELTEGILPEDMEKLLPHGSRPPVSVTYVR